MNRDTLVLYCWGKTTTFQVKLQLLVRLPNTTEGGLFQAYQGWSPWFFEWGILSHCHCHERIFHCWVHSSISLRVRAWNTVLSWCKTYFASKFLLGRRSASPGMGGISASGRVLVTGMVDTFQKEQEDACTLYWKLLRWRCWGKLQLSQCRSWDDFLASFSFRFYFLHISFESKLLLEQTQI